MKRRALVFTGPRDVTVVEEELSGPGHGEVLVATTASGISAGTELLIYRGDAPTDMALDASIAALEGSTAFPLRYGYAAVGRIVDIGPGVDRQWLDRHVFAFQPHASHFVAPVDDLLALPEGVDPEDGAFIPNLETAVNLVMDGRPLVGERVLVIGQGVVGLLTTALLARFPLEELVTLDRIAGRRAASLALGARAASDPAEADALSRLTGVDGFDLTFELTGNPAALDQAIALTGYAGRVIIGSWYGRKAAPLNLGGRFHRSRIHLISSQVSTIAPELTGRWTKARRFATVLAMLPVIRPSQFVTQRFRLDEASAAYALLDREPERAIQVLLTYV